jgi:hypothetical protein
MALPTTFSARVRTSVAGAPVPRADLSPVAEGLSVLGRVGSQAVERDAEAERKIAESNHELAVEEQRRERSRQALSFGAQLGEARVTYQQKLEEARAQTDPGAPGWTDKAKEIANEVFAPLAGTYANDEELAAKLAPQLQSVVSGALADEATWEVKQRTAWEGEQHQVAVQTEADGVMGKPTPEVAAAALERLTGQIAQTDFDGTTKAKLAHHAGEMVYRALADGLANSGQYDQLGALLDAGTLDGWLGNTKDNYQRTVAAGRQAQAHQAEIDANERAGSALDALKTIQVDIGHDADVPESRITAAFNAAKAAGVDESKLHEFAYLSEEMVNRRQFRGLTDAGLQGEVARLQTRQSAGKLSDAENRRLDQARKALGDRDQAKAKRSARCGSPAPRGRRRRCSSCARCPRTARGRRRAGPATPAWR